MVDQEFSDGTTNNVSNIFPNLPPLPTTPGHSFHGLTTSEMLSQVDELKTALADLINEEEPECPLPPVPTTDILFSEGRRLNRDEIACISNRPLTDLGNSERLLDQFGTYIRYCPAIKMWYIWESTEGRWKQDNIGKIYELAKEVIRRIYIEASRAHNPDEAKKMSAWAFACETDHHITTMVKIAQTKKIMIVEPEIWDSNDYILNFNNGTLDLLTGQVRAHNKDDLISKTVGYNFDPKAKCPQWLVFLDRIFRNRSDKKEIIEYIQRSIGYSLTGVTIEEALYMCYGSGQNGKSVFLEVIRKLLGEYSAVAEGNSFTVSKHSADTARARPDIACLVGKRLVCVSENSTDSYLDSSTIKHLTSCEDRIKTRFLFKEEFEFKPRFKIWWAFNHQPQVHDQTHSLWRRIKVILFEETITEDEKDTRLTSKLKTEMPGIMNWAIHGLVAYNQSGLGEPKVITQATDQYRSEEDKLLDYISLNIDRIPEGQIGDFRIRAREVYNNYVTFVNQENPHEKPMSETMFGRLMKEKGFIRKKETSGMFYLNLKFRTGIVFGKKQ